MKIAEALQIRADLQKRLAQMPVRLANNARVQEGGKPTENPDDLLAEMTSLLDRIEQLDTKINLTNASVVADSGETITALMARRDRLRREVDMTRAFVAQAGNLMPREKSTDLRVVATVDVAGVQKRCDRLAHRLRDLDIKIQELNWTSELLP